jgi:hypothetical protein
VCVIHVSATANSRAHRERHDLEIVDVGELRQVRRIDGQVVDGRSCRDHRIKAHFACVPNPTRCNRRDDVLRMPIGNRTRSDAVPFRFASTSSRASDMAGPRSPKPSAVEGSSRWTRTE